MHDRAARNLLALAATINTASYECENTVKLPDWQQCCDHVKTGTATALETFIYHNEPADGFGAGFQSESDFREGLLAVITELLAKRTARNSEAGR